MGLSPFEGPAYDKIANWARKKGIENGEPLENQFINLFNDWAQINLSETERDFLFTRGMMTANGNLTQDGADMFKRIQDFCPVKN